MGEQDRRGRLAGLLAFTFGPVLLVLAVTALQTAVPRTTLMREPHATAGLPWYVGAVSNFGIVVWACAGAVALFAAWTVGRRSPSFRVLAAGGLLTLALMADDLLLLHEQVFPEYLGFPEHLLFAGYGLAVLALLGVCRSSIRGAQWLLLGGALGLFAASLAIDRLRERLGVGDELGILLEDGPKLLGMAAWLAFFALVARDAVEPAGALKRGRAEEA